MGIFGKKTIETKFEYVPEQEVARRFMQDLGVNGSEQQKKTFAKNMGRSDFLDPRNQLRSATIETIRDYTQPGAVSKADMQKAISNVMHSDAGWKEKFDMLDMLETRAINGLDDYDDQQAIERRIGDMQEDLLRQAGRLDPAWLGSDEAFYGDKR